MAECRRLVSAATAPASPGPRREARRTSGVRESRWWSVVPVGRGPGPWGSDEPTEIAAVLEKCAAEGFVTQETLDLACEEFECFVKFSEREKVAKIRAEINENELTGITPYDWQKEGTLSAPSRMAMQPLLLKGYAYKVLSLTNVQYAKKLETELLQLELETADIVHPFYLSKKYQILQDVNRHLEAVLKEKRRLRQRLIKPICQETLPIKADFHKYVVELLTEAVAFIEKLENHLQTVKTIPQVPTFMKNLDIALTKTEVLVTDLEELTEQILQWREVQKEVYSDSICNTAELDLGLST